MRALLLFAAAAVLVSPAAQDRGKAVLPRGADAWTLFRGLTQAATVEVVCAEDELRPFVAHAIERSRSRTAQRLALVTPEASDPALPRIVVGSLADPWVAALAHQAGLATAGGDGLSMCGPELRRSSDVLVATVADPEREGLPLTMHLGLTARTVALDLDHVIPHWRPGLLARRGGVPFRCVPLRPGGGPDWDAQIDYIEHRRGREDGSNVRSITAGDRLVVRILSDVDRERAAAYAELAGRVDAAVRAVFGSGRVDTELRLLPSVEVAEQHYGLFDLSRIVATEQVSALVLLAPGMPHDGGASAARTAALAALGPTQADWMLDGIGTAFGETWWGRPREAWAAYVRSAGFAPTAAELAATDADARFSPHVLGPLRGQLFALVLERLGADATARIWTGADELVFDAGLEAAFQARLDDLAATYREPIESARAARRAAASAKEWRGGVHVAPARGDLDRAFAADDVLVSLASAAAAGATSAAFTPLVFLEPRETAFAGEPLRRRPDGAPGDLALVHALNSARAAGLDTLLAPELVSTSSGTWFDAQALGDEHDVEAMFAEATCALEHYGLLAELCGVDVLCLASECNVISTTLPREADGEGLRARFERFRGGWSALIARARATFCGALIYAAEPLLELERVQFWPELDLVGIDLWATVVKPTGAPSRAAAERRIAGIVSDAARFAAEVGRPLLIVQTGFPSNTTAHDAPQLGSGTVDVEQQTALYGVLADVLEAARERAELAGVFLWRWDPDAAAGGTSDSSHTPQGKPAALALRRLLGR